jgi:hypothetical protein
MSCRNIAKGMGDPTGPRLSPRHASDRGKEIDPYWRYAELNNDIRFGEIRRRQPNVTKSKVLESPHYSLGIVCRGLDQQIEITRRPRDAVKRERVRADDDGVNVMVVERREQL